MFITVSMEITQRPQNIIIFTLNDYLGMDVKGSVNNVFVLLKIMMRKYR